MSSRTHAGDTRYYTYDPVGNLLGKRVPGPGEINQTYDPVRPHAVTSAQGALYAYDADGNVVERVSEHLRGPLRSVAVVIERETASI